MSDLTFAPSVELINGNVRTTSLKVAEHFGKRHDTVLRAIKQLDCSEDFTARNFAVSEYRDASGKANLFYEMSRDGFTFVAMGFTGKEAARWKEAYITAFNAMEAKILAQERQNALKSLESPSLTASEQQTLSEIVDLRARECENQGKAKAEIWSRLHRKFRVAKYSQLRRDKLGDAIAYVMLMDIKATAISASATTYSAPLSLWKPGNKVGDTGWLTYPELTKVETPLRPIAVLLRQLSNDGHDIEGAQAEYSAIKVMLDQFYWRLNTMAEIFERLNHHGLRIIQH